MPRLTRLRVGALEDLAGQLRFAPRRRIIAQLGAARALADEIDPERTYPEDWVVYRITGFRPETEDPALLVGEALRGDLSAFVERVSDRAELTAADLPEFLTIDELAARWGVNRKTLERARRRGLIAQRYRDESRGVRLAFPVESVEAYERRHGEGVSAAGAFARMAPEEAARLSAIGARAARRFGWSMNTTARRLAERTGRGRETMRQLLRRAPSQPGWRPGALTPRQRRVAERAHRRGVRVSVIARRYGRTPAAIRLVVNQRRLLRLRRLSLPEGPAAGVNVDELLRAPALAGAERFIAPRTVGEFIERAASTGKPDANTERALATAHRALLVRAGDIVRAQQRTAPRATALDRAEADLRSAAALRALLAGSQLGLALQTIEGRLGAPLGSLAPEHARTAHDAAVGAIAQAIAFFDPARGGRVAASAGLAINRALAPVERVIHERRAPVGDPEGTARAGLADWTRRVASWQRWLDLPAGFEARVAELPLPERRTLELRHGLSGVLALTPEEIAEALGMTRVAVVRSQRAGIRRLRELVRAGEGADR